MDVNTSGWAALVPWTGVQNVPSQLVNLAATNPVQGVVIFPIPSLTPTGTTGSLTFQNGALIGYVNPT